MNSVKTFVSSLSDEIRWHGGHNENSRQLNLKAGKLSLVYESGNLRCISACGKEVIRMIYSAVRDSSWITVKPVISDEMFEINTDSFVITYTAHYSAGEIDFIAYYVITGKEDNSVIFSFEGEALKDFEKNRVGFCVLHPIESNRGRICNIVHSNNIDESLNFPFEISPHQPFLDIKSMKWSRDGIDCNIDFFGDIFETEDQRNWTDASYKTYCTPLSNPKPLKILKGQKISQKVILGVNAGCEAPDNVGQKISIAIDNKNLLPFPKIGIGRSTRINPITKGETGLLRMLEFDHYRIDLILFKNDWKLIADNAFNEAVELGYNPEIALFFDDDYLSQISHFLEWITPKKTQPVVILLYHKNYAVIPDQIADKIAGDLKKEKPSLIVGCGTNANFVKINRMRSQLLHTDLICYSIHPQEHASDNMTLVENLQGQSYTVESAKQFSGNKKIWISPVNIQRRFNGNVSNYELPSENNRFPAQADSRLMSLFGAGWVSGSLKYLFESGAAGITLLETVGERGIIQGDYNSRWSGEFKSTGGMLFPVYFVLEFVLKSKKAVVLKSTSSDPLKVESLVFQEGNSLKLIIVNFTEKVQEVRIDDLSGEADLRSLNSETFCIAAGDKDWLEKSKAEKICKQDLSLEPYSVTFVEE